jgi:hypothetical protein
MRTIIEWLRKLFFKFFRRREETDSTIINYRFLKNASKLAKKGRAFLYKGGYKALTDAWYNKDCVVYILIIKKENKKKIYSLRQWFKNFR